MDELDIANFAEGLIEQDRKSGKAPQMAAPTAPSPGSPDISDITVPSNYANTILSESFNVQTPSVKKHKLDEEAVYKKQLVQSYKTKLKELEGLVEEMTALGMAENMAVNIGGTTTVGHGGITAGAPPLGGRRRRRSVSDRINRRRKK